MRRFYLFRHGETDWNREGRIQGHIDVPMNELGRAQAHALAPQLRRSGLQVILSSDLQRTEETARIIARTLGVPVFLNRALREAHLGEAQGLNQDEIKAKFGEELFARWRSSHLSDADVAYTGGETGQQIITRVMGALEAFIAEQPFERVGVSTHGGVIRRIAQHLMPHQKEPLQIPNGILYEIVYDERNRIWSFGGPSS